MDGMTRLKLMKKADELRVSGQDVLGVLFCWLLWLHHVQLSGKLKYFWDIIDDVISVCMLSLSFSFSSLVVSVKGKTIKA